ncbi:MAG: pantetheine-phosphate adenylyltransferase [Ruminococcaceae bacterium]|nr:pantetheine-phosphate adenylyltransferase [Oscillospiraceae bacterium]
MKTAVYPGSFDPITNGHLDIIIRAANIFDRLVVAVLNNSSKTPLFTVEERVELIRDSIPKVPGCEIEVTSFDGLLADFAQSIGATTVIKGLRAVSDFEYEFQMALANRKINHRLDTAFLMTSERYMYLSSSLVRDLGRYGGDISDFVPLKIQKRVIDKLRK